MRPGGMSGSEDQSVSAHQGGPATILEYVIIPPEHPPEDTCDPTKETPHEDTYIYEQGFEKIKNVETDNIAVLLNLDTQELVNTVQSLNTDGMIQIFEKEDSQ